MIKESVLAFGLVVEPIRTLVRDYMGYSRPTNLMK
jgi:hypothetical protein